MHQALAAELSQAIRAGDVARVEAILDRAPALLDGSGAGPSPLTLATYAGQRQIANLLIARGATVDIFQAAALDLTDQAQVLLAEEPELIASYSQDGWPPLHLAAFFGSEAMARLLLSRHASVHARSRSAEGNTPLHAAVAGRQPATVDLLLAAGSDVNAQDSGGWTALNLAAHEGIAAMVESLLHAGADPTIPSDTGQTPCQTAEREGHTELLPYFPADGAALS
jgi:ankyrin repeat protein